MYDAASREPLVGSRESSASTVIEEHEMFTIYHVVGIKVGCTKNFDRRKLQNEQRYSSSIQIEVLTELPLSIGDQVAGDIEHAWAEKLGYRKANHYT
jgi:hypothetical protein